MIRAIPYFYDTQQRRFLEQIVRAFSGFQYQTGVGRDGQRHLMMVPCRIASTNRQVAAIMRNLSENTLLSVPMITVWQTDLKPRFEDLQNPAHVDVRQVSERAVDPQTGAYTGARGKTYTVERLMPLPFTMNVQVDIWTSTMDQKHQLAEQILMCICPYFDIQNSDNALDWTALSTAYVEDITFSSRTIPVGTESEIDIMTVQLRLPIWISPPAKVQQQTLIEQIVTNINDMDQLPGGLTDAEVQGARMSQLVTTPGNYTLKVRGNIMTLETPNGEEMPWEPYLHMYGGLRPAASQIMINSTHDIEKIGVVGTIQLNPSNENELLWQVDSDTLPSNTLPPINGILDPLKHFPGEGNVPAAAEGQRYLLLNDIGGPTQVWGNLSGKYGDIIQYQNGEWVVSFACANQGEQYVLNLNQGTQLRWNGDDWVMAIDGDYAPGFWRVWI